jgi:Xaa-Pro aminopeptidase
MSAEECSQRRTGIAAQLRHFKADVLLVSSLPNVRYLTGFTGSNGLVVLASETAVLFTDPRYTIQASSETDCRVEIVKGSPYAAAAKLIARRRWKRVGIERNRLTFGAFAELQDLLGRGAELVALPPAVEQRRMVKSGSEIDLIRESVQTNSRAFEKAVLRLKATATETDLAAELEYQMRRFGAEKPAFETIVASGARSARPHAQPTRQPIGGDRLLLVDMGAVQAGYSSDMTRMLHLGKPGRKAAKLYKAVLEAQLAAIDAAREGVTAGTVDRAARRVLKKHGMDDLFVHSTGHGLGLEIHEPPRLGKKDDTRLEAGMVVTIEPGAYIEGFGGVRIEDTVVITRNGCEVLTPTSKDLLVM